MSCTVDSHEEGGLCSSLPVEVTSVALVWCSHHQTFTMHASKTRQEDQDVTVLAQRRWHAGPFDTIDEVLRQGLAALGDLLER